MPEKEEKESLIRYTATIEDKKKGVQKQDRPIIFYQVDSRDKPMEKYSSALYCIKQGVVRIGD